MNNSNWKSFAPLLLLCALSIKSQAFYNMAYVEVNSNALGNAGCYILSGTKKPFFNIVSVFAGNINGNSPNNATVYLNPQVQKTLDDQADIQQLRKKNIKVLLTILGNHQRAGWSCFTSADAARKFADQLVKVVNTYHLDGIDIDDEYSYCQENNYSMIMVAEYLKHNPSFKGKLLTKALYEDAYIFEGHYQSYKLTDFLDYGWEMSYGIGPVRLLPYVGYGMTKKALALGVSTNNTYSPVGQWTSEVMKDGYGGMMVYNVTANSRSYLTKLAKAEYGQSVSVLPQCLK